MWHLYFWQLLYMQVSCRRCSTARSESIQPKTAIGKNKGTLAKMLFLRLKSGLLFCYHFHIKNNELIF